MAKRKSKKKAQADLLQSLVGLVMVGVFMGAYQVTKSFVVTVGCVIVAVGVMIGIRIAVNMQHAERLKRSGIAEIDKMDGRQFEHYLGHLFRSQGFAVEVTRAAGDYGADLVIVKGGKKTIVQAKRYSKNVGLKAVQEVQTAIAHYRAQDAIVITNSDFTEQAYNLAKSNRVRLINREELIEMVLAMKNKQQSVDKSKQHAV